MNGSLKDSGRIQTGGTCSKLDGLQSTLPTLDRWMVVVYVCVCVVNDFEYRSVD